MTKKENKWILGITDRILPPGEVEKAAFPEAEIRFLSNWRESNKNLAEWKEVDALLVWHWIVDSATAQVLDRCKIVVRYGVGYDRVDIKALSKRDIIFCNTPDYGTEEVADSACAMILGLQRKITAYDRACRYYKEGWQVNVLKPIKRTSETTLGLIGVGRIGTAVVNRMKAFGYKIIGYDPYQPSGHEKAVGYVRANALDDLLEQSDIISLHCPLTDETRGMVDSHFFKKMKAGASIVNTARGEIFADLTCLEEALRSGHLAAASLDVLPAEPPPKDHSLTQSWLQDEEWIRGRFLINPHAAFYSERALYEDRFKCAETARLFLVDGKMRNRIIE